MFSEYFQIYGLEWLLRLFALKWFLDSYHSAPLFTRYRKFSFNIFISMSVHLFHSNGWTTVKTVQTNIMHSHFPKSVANDILTPGNWIREIWLILFFFFFKEIHIQSHTIQYISVINWIGLSVICSEYWSEILLLTQSVKCSVILLVYMSKNVTKRHAVPEDWIFGS